MKANENIQSQISEDKIAYLVTSNRVSVLVAIAFLVVSALVLVAVAIYTLGSRHTKQINSNQKSTLRTLPATQHTPTVDPTVNWRTFTNVKYRYSIKYPPDSTVSEADLGYVWFDRQILVSVTRNDPASCRGDCPIAGSATHIVIGQWGGEKSSGYIGAIGGNTPQGFESVTIPARGLFYTFTVYELKTDSTIPPDRTPGPVPQNEKRILGLMLSTWKLNQ